MTHYYSIFKTDNISGKTILICGGSHDTIEECNIHWISFLYGFMDGAFELLGRNGFQMINGLVHKDRSFIIHIDGKKDVEYFMLLDEEADSLIKEISKQ